MASGTPARSPRARSSGFSRGFKERETDGAHSDRPARHEGPAPALHARLARGQPHLRRGTAPVRQGRQPHQSRHQGAGAPLPAQHQARGRDGRRHDGRRREGHGVRHRRPLSRGVRRSARRVLQGHRAREHARADLEPLGSRRPDRDRGRRGPRRRWRMLRPLAALLLVVLAVTLAPAPPTDAQSKTLVITGYGGRWSEIMKKALVEPFEKQHGVKVEVVTGITTEWVAKLLAAGPDNPPFDVVMGNEPPLVIPRDRGFFDKRNEALAPNIKNVY